MRRVFIGSLLLAALAIGSAWQPSAAQAAPAGGMGSLAQDAAAQRPVTEAHYYHRRRHVGFSFYGPGFGFYVAPRHRYRRHYYGGPYYYRPYRSYRSYHYYRPYRHHRHWRRW
jgi:hypothetical protein